MDRAGVLCDSDPPMPSITSITQMRRNPEQLEREIIGRNIELMLHAHGMKASGLADAIGATPQQVSTWMRARVRPSARYLNKIADVFGKTPGWFVDPHPDLEPPNDREEHAA
jgi:transcriptional regulator with XRE-family HTH domain